MIREIPWSQVLGRTVLVRADLNVPFADGKIADATRIDRILGTLVGLVNSGAAVVVISHRGRPGGQHDPDLSLAPVASALAEGLGQPVQFVDDCIGEESLAATAALGRCQVALLENLRFHAGEEAGDPEFASALARHGTIYVNDAFSCCHRAHASVDEITRLLPSAAGIGLLAEIDALGRVLDLPERRAAAMVGGAKISSKIGVLRHLVDKVECLIIGGAMANTFLAAQGVPVGKSLVESDCIPLAGQMMETATAAGCRLLLPEDAVVADRFAAGAISGVFPIADLPPDGMILDIGPATVVAIERTLAQVDALLWNGPLGAFEVEPFGEGTFAVARAAAARTSAGHLVTVAGGGDTVAALNAAGVGGAFTYVSTAGGAFLEWIEGRRLPGIVALEREGPRLPGNGTAEPV